MIFYNRGALRLITLTIVIFIALLLLSPWRGEGIKRWDPQFYFYTGWQIIQGKVLYRDIWEHKPPLIYLTGALYVLTGLDGKSLPYYDFIALSISLTAFYWLATQLFRRTLATWSVILYVALVFRNDFYFNGPYMPEIYATLFSLLSIVLFVKVDTCANTGHHNVGTLSFLMGLCAAVSSLYKETSLLSLAPWHLYFIVRAWAMARRSLILYGIGLLLPFIIFVLWLFHHKIAPDYYDALINNHEMLVPLKIMLSRAWLMWVVFFFNVNYCFGKLWLLCTWFCIAICSVYYLKPSIRRYLLLVVMSFIFEFVSTHGAQIIYLHYYNQFIWSLTLILLAPFALLYSWTQRVRNYHIHLLARSCVITGVATLVYLIYNNSSYNYPDYGNYFKEVNAYVDILTHNSSPVDCVQNIGGNDSLIIQNRVRRLAANKYSYQYHWHMSGETESRRRREAEFLSLLKKRSADLVVWGLGEPFCPYRFIDPHLVKMLEDELAAHYVPIDHKGRVPRIFRRRG